MSTSSLPLQAGVRPGTKDATPCPRVRSSGQREGGRDMGRRRVPTRPARDHHRPCRALLPRPRPPTLKPVPTPRPRPPSPSPEPVPDNLRCPATPPIVWTPLAPGGNRRCRRSIAPEHRTGERGPTPYGRTVSPRRIPPCQGPSRRWSLRCDVCRIRTTRTWVARAERMPSGRHAPGAPVPRRASAWGRRCGRRPRR